MWSSMVDLFAKERRILFEALRTSSEILIDHADGRDLEAKDKGFGGVARDPVFVTDIASELNINAILAREFPGEQYYLDGEERGRYGELPENGWVADPLDGTASFEIGFRHFVAVSLGFCREGKMMLGGVSFPFLSGKPIYWAEREKCAHVIYADGTKRKLARDPGRSPTRLENAATEYFKGAHKTETHRRVGGDVAKLLVSGSYRTFNYGSGVLSLIQLARGGLDACIKIATTAPGDHGPAMFIAMQGGAKVSDVYGNRPRLDMPSVVGACNQRLLDHFLEKIEPYVSDLPRAERRDGKFGDLDDMLRCYQD
jgi:fructose-1,6-bisphosphatase/inositol monophosphatase family enzyme